MKRNRAGFTLIETIIYIGLFTLLIGGSLLSVNQMLQGSAQVNNKSTVQDEGNFVLRKIDWALGGMDPTQPYTPDALTPNSTILSVVRYDGIHVIMRLNAEKVEISENGGTSYAPITTDNVVIGSLGFTFIQPTGAGPGGITASMAINGIVESTTRYIRK